MPVCTAQAQTPSSAHTEAAQPCQLRAPAAPASTGPGWLWEPGSSPVLCFHQPRSPGFLQLASSSGAAQMLLKARSYNSVLQKSETKKQAAAPPSTWIKLAVYHLRGETALARSEGREAEEPHSGNVPERGNVCAHLPKRHRLVPANTHTLYKPSTTFP